MDNGHAPTLPTIAITKIFRYLPHRDRIHASSVCKHWRACLYHPAFWQRLNLHFTPHNMQLLRAMFLTRMCAHFARAITVYVQSPSTWCVDEFINMLDQVKRNRLLRALHLNVTNYTSMDFGSPEVFHSVVKPLLDVCEQLDEFTLGGCESLCTYLLDFMDRLGHNPAQYRVLGLASVSRHVNDFLPIGGISPCLFEGFSNLTILSFDYDVASGDLLHYLRCARHLQRIVVHVSQFKHVRVSGPTWEIFVKDHPQCEIRISFIYSKKGVRAMTDILAPCMPVTHLKVLFCRACNLTALEQIGQWYRQTLRSLIWVDCRGTSNEAHAFTQNNLLNPLVMLSWQCTKLEQLIMFGYKFHRRDINGICLLRNLNSSTLVFGHNDLHDDCEPLIRINETSGGTCWEPLKEKYVHAAIKSDSNRYDRDDFVLPLVQADVRVD